jgi:hypothetical protein
MSLLHSNRAACKWLLKEPAGVTKAAPRPASDNILIHTGNRHYAVLNGSAHDLYRSREFLDFIARMDLTTWLGISLTHQPPIMRRQVLSLISGFLGLPIAQCGSGHLPQHVGTRDPVIEFTKVLHPAETRVPTA